MHTCSRTTSSTSIKQRKGTPGLVAGIVSELYPGQLELPAPKSLVVLVQGNASVNVSYSTAWIGKQKALSMVCGSPEESYNDLYSYLYMLEQVNPDTRTSVLLDEQKRFKYVFVALGACIEGFRAIRKVIIVDATFLKNQYGGVLIFATSQDPNHHHYPIAFAVVDAENNASWNWFFNTLKTVIPDSPELVFVSDKNASLIKEIGEVYPSSKHGYCIFHLSQNVRLHVRRDKDVVAETFRDCARLYTEAEFLEAYSELHNTYPNVGKYLDGSVDEAKWARCYFSGERYNIDTSNFVESMNSIFLDARKYSLLPIIDAIVAKLAGWFNKHRNDSVAASDTHKLVPFVENIVHGRVAIARKLSVSELNYFHLEYSVIGRDGKTYLVNLRRKTCDCKCFDIEKYPCVHAIAATIVFMKRPGKTKDIHVEELCSKYYLMETWALAYYRTIYLVPHKSQWIIPDNIQQLCALPSNYKKKG